MNSDPSALEFGLISLSSLIVIQVKRFILLGNDAFLGE